MHRARVLVMVMRILIAGAVAWMLSACNKSYEVYGVDGISDKFCVPERHIVGRIPWIPSSTPEGDGFAFAGCWRGDLKDESDCPLPMVVVVGVVSSAANFRSQRWQDIGEDSLVKRTIHGAGASLEVADEGRTIVASNARAYWGWFVWRKAEPLANGEEAKLEAGDELLATCQKKDVALPGTSATRPAIWCERHVLGKDYALEYTFEAEDRVPKDVEELDARVFAGIDRWRCQK